MKAAALRAFRRDSGSKRPHKALPRRRFARPLLELIKQSRHVVHRQVLPELAAHEPKVGAIVTFVETDGAFDAGGQASLSNTFLKRIRNLRQSALSAAFTARAARHIDAYHDANRIIGRFAHELLVLNRVGRTHQPSLSIDDDAATAA